MARLLGLERLYTRVFEVPGRVPDARFPDEK